LAASAAIVASTGLFAKTSDRPTVTVLAFETPTKRFDGGALADDFAAALIDANRSRVLPRQWLTIPHKAAKTLEPYLASAAAAGVQFVVAGTVTCVRPRLMASSLRGPTALVVDVRVVSTDSGHVVRRQTVRLDPPPLPQVMLPRSNALLPLLTVNVQQRPMAGWEIEAVRRAVISIASTLQLDLSR
jgi:hypothetical protein